MTPQLPKHEKGYAMLLVVLIVLGMSLTAGVVVVSGYFLDEESNYTITQLALRQTAMAVSGAIISPVPLYQRSYERDVGALPASLAELITKPGAVAACAYNATANIVSGWCGPYVTVPFANQIAFLDEWGRTLIYDAAGRRVYSVGPNGVNNSGGTDDIVQIF